MRPARFPAAIRGRASSRSFRWEATQFLEGFHGGAVFAHDAGVVAAHLVPEMVQRKLAVQDTAVQAPNVPNASAEKSTLCSKAIGDHHFRPVNHRRHIGTRVLAEQNAFALLTSCGEVDAVISVEHLKVLALPTICISCRNRRRVLIEEWSGL